jgi:hypothetical protein
MKLDVQIEDNIPYGGKGSVEVYDNIAETILSLNPKQSFFMQKADIPAFAGEKKNALATIKTSLKGRIEEVAPPDFTWAQKIQKDVAGTITGIRFWRLS